MERFEIIKCFENCKTRIFDLVKVMDIDSIQAQIASYEQKMLD